MYDMNEQLVLGLLGHYKYLLLFPAAVIEGPIVTVLVGLLAAEGKIDAYAAFAIVVVADLVSDTFWYICGKYAYHRMSSRIKKRLGIQDSVVEKYERAIRKHFGKIIFMGKFTQVFAAIIELAAGVANIPYGTFLFFNTINTILKSGIFLLIGFFFGNAYQQISTYLNIYTNVILVASFFLSILLTEWLIRKEN